MGDTLGTLLPFAGAIAVSPVTIGVVLALVVGRAQRHLPAFLATWFVVMAVAVATLLLLVPRGAGPSGASTSALTPYLGTGLLLLAVAALWRARRSRAQPSLVSQLDRASPALLVGIAAVFAGNPKNLALVTAGADALDAPVPAGGGLLVVAVAFALVTSVPLLAAAVASSLVPAASTLDRANEWLAAHGDTVGAVVLATVGTWVLLR